MFNRRVPCPIVFPSSREPPSRRRQSVRRGLPYPGRFEGIDDAHNPNHEFLDLTIDLRVGPSLVTTGMKFRFKKAGLSYDLPAGLTLNAARPTIRFYVGSGTATADTIYLGRPAGLMSNLVDDCIDVVYTGGAVAKFNLGGCT